MANFEDVFDDVTKEGRKIPKESYLSKGLYPIIDQGQEYISGYTNDASGLYCKVPAIIFGDHTRIIKYVDTPFFLGADGVKLLRAKIPNANYKYLYYALCNARIPNTGYNRHFKWLKEVNIPLPGASKQERIVSVLDKVNDLITLRKQQFSKLDELVKARFVEMFGDIIHNNMNWPTFLLSNVTNSRLGKMLDAKQQTGQYRFPYLANLNVQWFRFEIAELNEMDFNEADQKEFELKDGDLLVCEGGEVGRCAVWHDQVVPCYFQKALHRIRCNLEIIEPNYLSWWFKFHCDYNQFEDIVGSKATIAHLPGAKLKKLEVVVPPIDLQRQFSAFIDQVEKCKLTIQQGLDKLEMMKNALIQQYFGDVNA